MLSVNYMYSYLTSTEFNKKKSDQPNLEIAPNDASVLFKKVFCLKLW